jgi:1-deoxy-D-xylulose-5-phosphate reductoisomerase
MEKIAVLGSTGSVGGQTLEVIDRFRDRFRVSALLARRASEKLLEQAVRFKPKLVVSYEEPTKEWLSKLPEECEYAYGEEGLKEAIRISDKVMNAVSGVHGIKPAYHTLREGKTLLASNKESIICLGELVSNNRRRILPVDSEHNAIFQLLDMVNAEFLKHVYLTASGGPFKNKSIEEMRQASIQEALNHPRWSMGQKITIDSATLMNKGFELLEAKNLFGIPLDDIKVVIHPQSHVHAVVELIDGSFIMHVSPTDMRVPIIHVLFYPRRVSYPFGKPRITEFSPLEFEPVDTEKFRSLYLARWAGEMGGVYLPVLVGADEEAVNLFLEGRIGFLNITELIEEVLGLVNLPEPESVEDILNAVEWARSKVRERARALERP